jgi:hypothetical protein
VTTCQDFVVIKLGGVVTIVVASATAVCGLLMLSGAGPTPAAAGDTVLEPEITQPTPLAAVESSTTTSTTSTSTTSTTTTSTTTSTTAPAPPIPLSVEPHAISVGAGGTARISGECPVVGGAPLGPVEIWQIGSTVTPIATGVTAAAWSYDWTAPSDVEPLVLQIWCGDPSQYQGGYPEALQVEVVFVAQVAPTTTTTPEPSTPHEIPETG